MGPNWFNHEALQVLEKFSNLRTSFVVNISLYKGKIIIDVCYETEYCTTLAAIKVVRELV